VKVAADVVDRSTLIQKTRTGRRVLSIVDVHARAATLSPQEPKHHQGLPPLKVLCTILTTRSKVTIQIGLLPQIAITTSVPAPHPLKGNAKLGIVKQSQ
jgi:hypothetical protein